MPGWPEDLFSLMNTLEALGIYISIAGLLALGAFCLWFGE